MAEEWPDMLLIEIHQPPCILKMGGFCDYVIHGM
jgi:hypothetical protein